MILQQRQKSTLHNDKRSIYLPRPFIYPKENDKCEAETDRPEIQLTEQLDRKLARISTMNW